MVCHRGVTVEVGGMCRLFSLFYAPVGLLPLDFAPLRLHSRFKPKPLGIIIA